ncbi:MAG: shikimate dehydrogenase [Acidimicrobiales bacterium]
MTGRAPSTPDRARPLSAATVVVGVIGDPVAHSLSPLIHNACFDALGLPWISVGFPVRAGRAPDALHGAIALGIRGLSVTMPHKEAVAAIGERTLLVEALGAANCVVAGDGGWVAHNTDGPGFVTSLRRELEFEPDDRRCLVVGAGGAARAIIAALAEAGAREVVVVNRSEWRAEQALVLAGPAGRRGVTADASGCDLVVNATPVGMDPGEDGAGSPGGRVGREAAPAWPVEPIHLGPGQVVVDLVYHPPVTPWLEAAARRGATAVNGLGMLVHQAAAQLRLWTGCEPPIEAMWEALPHRRGRIERP